MGIANTSRPIRVANIIEEGKLGGPQIRIVAAAAAMKGCIDTTVIMPLENSGAFQERCENAGVAYKAMPISRITKEWRVALRYVLFSFNEIARIVLFLKQGDFDIVHASGGSWQYKGVIAGKLAGKKVLWHLNDTSMPRVFRHIFSLISPLADGFIFASERSKVYYKPLVRSQKTEYVIPAPVDTTKFNLNKSFSEDKYLLDKWGDKFIIGTAANINPIKGIETFIRTAAAFNRCHDNAHFVVVGPVYQNQQKYFKQLTQLCSELSLKNIEFVGPRSDVRPILKRFDIYVCSSIAESSPLSVWEAMAMGKPVISTDVGDVPLYIRDGFNGFIVNIEDSQALSERLLSMAADSTMLSKIGLRARDIAVRELDVKKCAHRHVLAYEGVLVDIRAGQSK